MTFVSGKQIQLKVKLNPGDSSLIADIDVGTTEGRIYFIDDNQEEWLSFTGVATSGSNFEYTGLTRRLSQTADPATGGTGLTWLAGNIGTVVAMHDQMVDKKANNTFEGTQTFTSLDFIGTSTIGLKVKNLTTTQRLAATPSNGMIVYDTTEGVLYQYIGGTWTTFATGSVINASLTEAGKVEIATNAESIAGTDIGGTGALLSVLPSDVAKNDQSNTFKYAVDVEVSDAYVISLNPNLTAYTTGQEITFRPNTTNTGACTINIDGLGAKSIKLIDGTNPLDGDITTGVDYKLIYNGINFVLQQVPIRATEAEVVTGTNTLKYVVPSQMPKRTFLQTSRSSDAASGIVSIAHGLGKTPKYIELSGVTLISTALIQFCHGLSDGILNYSDYVITGSGTYSVATSSASCYVFQENDAGNHYVQTATVTLDSTNVNINWTRTGSAGTQKSASINILVVA